MRRLLRQFKRQTKILLRKDVNWKVQCKQLKERFGSEFGGWDVATKMISKDSIVYSVGVGEDITFDLELIERFGVIVHAFDPTPKSINWVRKQNLPDNFILHEYGLADFDGKVRFNPPENPDHVSHTILERTSTGNKAITVPVRRLETIMKDLGHNRIDMLKMDIEGAEYQVIEGLINSNVRPMQILVEFHHRFQNVTLSKTQTAIAQLNNMGYCLFSISVSGEEFGFIHNAACANADG